ncbi:MAG TPA: hypothetical protein VGB07_31170 [Blastocatellia bacterium]
MKRFLRVTVIATLFSAIILFASVSTSKLDAPVKASGDCVNSTYFDDYPDGSRYFCIYSICPGGTYITCVPWSSPLPPAQ